MVRKILEMQLSLACVAKNQSWHMFMSTFPGNPIPLELQNELCGIDAAACCGLTLLPAAHWTC